MRPDSDSLFSSSVDISKKQLKHLCLSACVCFPNTSWPWLHCIVFIYFSLYFLVLFFVFSLYLLCFTCNLWSTRWVLSVVRSALQRRFTYSYLPRREAGDLISKMLQFILDSVLTVMCITTTHRRVGSQSRTCIFNFAVEIIIQIILWTSLRKIRDENIYLSSSCLNKLLLMFCYMTIKKQEQWACAVCRSSTTNRNRKFDVCHKRLMS